MLDIEPLEKLLYFEPNKQISCSIQLTNDTNDYIAFIISTTSPCPYNIHPSIDIVRPGSKVIVTISLNPLKKALPQERCKELFLVQSTRVVDASVKAADIAGDLFDDEPGRVVDNVEFRLILDVPPLSVDWSYPAQFILEATLRKHTPWGPTCRLANLRPRSADLGWSPLR
ncbi:hypothetical protein PR202_ga12392 [Eleusine coracana subsp. coracana]|uniref:MSP domain-containing protein n=1 Tax=Eleusine coracana subsp. coracana TaxID=191504 RepID=A0AAV5CBZ8_ELECO|nr:hypothetical protein PR202_ga12392 [Eleusine coracana subsp. coracana]